MEDQHIKGGYDLEGVIWHQHSNKLMVKILELFPKDIPVIDLGCGHNFYVSVLKYAGYEAIGIDMTDLGSKHFLQKDLTKFPLFNTKDWKLSNVISLEVGEHIPYDLHGGYIDNLCSFGEDIIMSWATKGQPGVGHINCQNNDWVISQMLKRGYQLNSQKTKELRSAVDGCHCSWFKNTLMYFN